MPIDADWFETERLHRAATDADLPELRRLIEAGFALDDFDDADRTPLHRAADAGHRDVAQCLFELGAGRHAGTMADAGTPVGGLAARL